MEKHIEENPNDIDREDEIRINKNDISKKKKSLTGFAAMEQIPTNDSQDVFAQDIEEVFQEGENEEFGFDEKIAKKEKEEKLRKEILTFHQHDGVASISSEEPEEHDGLKHAPFIWSDEKPKKEEEFADSEKEITPRVSRRKNNDPITSMSSSQVNRKTRSHLVGVEKENKYKASMNSHDTPKERSWGKRIKDFLFKQNNQQTSEGKLEQMYASHPLDKEYEEPTLNGNPIDKRFIEDEDVAA